MSVIIVDNSSNKNRKSRELLNKAELKNLLKKYKGILESSMVDYLDSLIGLEFSVIQDYISDSDRKVLSELEVYRKVAIYNIYNRALNLLKEKNIELDVETDDNSLIFNKKLDDQIIDNFGVNGINLFKFDYGETSFYERCPNEYKSMRIGDISLYQTFEDKNLREKELNRVMEKLESLYNQDNPYSNPFLAFGGPDSIWAFEHSQKIRQYEELFTQLDSKKELSDEDKKEIEMTNLIHDLLLEDYGLKISDFIQQTNSFDSEEKKYTEKTLVKEMPNLTINNYIKYI